MAERDIRYIAIEGVIGVGKTTLAKLLAERLGAELVLEEVEENPFLHEFYHDRARWAFQTQMHFLFSRYQQQRGLHQLDLFVQKLVSDYLFQKDRIFAGLNLTDRELLLYEKIVKQIELEIPKPDVVVYLQANTETLLARIQSRGRPFEKEMDREYLKALNEAYNYFFFHYSDAPLLVVQTDAIDFLRRPSDLDDLTKRILSHDEGTVYYAPLPSQEPSAAAPRPKKAPRRKPKRQGVPA
jgi:deoxyadenosine/deoxycytidine kinase